MALSEQLWARLIDDIESRNVIPVVGPELLVLNTGGERVLLSRYIARALADRLDVPEKLLPPVYNLDDLVCQYLRKPGSDVEELYYGVREVVAEASFSTPEPLKKLAAITYFDLYVCTTFDSLLEQALNEVRFDGAARTRSFTFSRARNPVDIPADYGVPYGGVVPAPAGPAVFHLFGKLGPLNDYALTDEDVIQFCRRLLSRDRPLPNLSDLFRNRKILALGCGFPGWLTRFFLAAAKGDQLFTEGARGVIADKSSASDLSLVLFLERRKTAVYSDGDAVTFVDKLHRLCMERLGRVGPAVQSEIAARDLPEFKPDSVFISYASEDRAQAQTIRDALERAGVDVWFDQRNLDAGDYFEEKILRSIERCSVFLPVISRNVTAARRRFFFREWDKAVDESKNRPDDDPFVQPIVIDDTPFDAEHIPLRFRLRTWQRAEGGRLPDEFVLRIRERIRDLRRQGASA